MQKPHLSEEEIFKTAQEIKSSDARTSYLKVACGDDAALHERVVALLQVAEVDPGFLEQPIGGMVDTIGMPPITEREGTQIGRYKLLQQIGEGGFGVVYMAEQTRPVRRKVALKIIKPGMDTKEVVARFEAERQALALMDHPNIAKVLDAGATDSQRPYFVMELVKGVPLTEYCDKNHLATRERLKLFVNVCHAVQHAHQKGIIHRDLKPSNIMVTLHDGLPVPKVIDFGVSKALSQQLTERTLFTSYGQMVGTPAYMSPEQAEMSGLDIDTRSDVYSLGVLLYELLTGTTPFDSKRLRTAGYAEMQRIIREEEPPKPSTRLTSLGASSTVVSNNRGTDPKQLGRLLRGELDWIVMQALEKDRNRRYETANGLAADVQRYLNDEPVVACPPTAAYRFRKFSRRYKARVALAASFALLLLVSSAIAWLLYADARLARDDAVEAELETQASLKVAETQRKRAVEQEQRADLVADELKLRLYDYNLIKAQSAYEQKDLVQTLRLLEDCLPEQRHWEWRRLQRVVGGHRTLKLPDTEISIFAVSPTEPRIAVFDDVAGTYQFFDLETGDKLSSGETGLNSHFRATFAPTGDRVAVTGVETTSIGNNPPHTTTTLQVWEAATGQIVWQDVREDQFSPIALFSPDGRSLVFGGIETRTRKAIAELIDLDKGKPIWRHVPGGSGLLLLRFTPDGKRLYGTVAGADPALYCWSIDGPEEVWKLSNIIASVPCPTPDGSHVITGGPNRSVRILAADDGRLIEDLTGGSDNADAFVFSPDGKYLSTVGFLGDRQIWDWDRKQIVNSLPAGGTSQTQLSIEVFTAASDEVVNARDRGVIDFLKVNPPPAEMILTGHEQAVKGVAFSPDGRQVASVSSDGTLRLWSPETGQELRTLTAHPEVYDLAYSPDGAYLATGGSDGTKLWSADRYELEHHWSDGGATWWVDFSSDSRRVLSGGVVDLSKNVGSVSVFEVTNGKRVFNQETPYAIDGLVFCADERYAASCGFHSGQLDRWDLQNDESEAIRSGERSELHYRCLARHPRGNQVALVVEDSIELWDLDVKTGDAQQAGGQLVKTLRADGVTPYCLAFNQDGTRLFVGDTNGRVSVWNVDTGEVLFSMQAHQPTDTGSEGRITGVHALTLSPDGTTLATAGADGLVKLWETSYPSKATAMQREIVREATEAVDQRYRTSPAHRDVIASLRAAGSLDKEVLETAIKIADARGNRTIAPLVIPSDETKPTPFEVHERLDEARRSFVRFVEASSRADFDAVDPNSPIECRAEWAWAANFQVLPKFKLAELEYLLDPLVEQYPEAHQFLCLRGFVHGRRGRYQDAVADFQAALERVPEKTGIWSSYAYVLSALYVHQGDFDRYQTLKVRALQNALETDDPRTHEVAAKIYLFSPIGGNRMKDAIHLAREASTRVPHEIFRWFSLAAGIAEYRDGNWELAIEILGQAQGPPGSQDVTRLATSNLFQSMAYAQLGEHDQAKAKRGTAIRIMNRSGFGKADFWNGLITQAVYNEAQKVLADLDTDNATAAGLAAGASNRRSARRIVPSDSEWRWLLPVDGVDPAADDAEFHATFFNPSFDDSHWKTGTDSAGPSGGFGYGDRVGVAFTDPGDGKRHTAYFRHRFTTDRAYQELIISMQRDDGVVVYLDGKEVGRNNVAEGVESYELFAPAEVSGEQETWTGFYALAGELEPGEHVLAISLHNSSPTDPDLRIAGISLWGTPSDKD